MSLDKVAAHRDDARRSARRHIIDRYARRKRNGDVLFCIPSKAELAGDMQRRETSGTDGKVVFPDLETAEAAARELEALGGGPQYAYVCRRSRHGHAHLTSVPWGAKPGVVSMIPEEVLAYYDVPDNAKAMCDLLMRTYPGWTVRRSADRVWHARHESWPAERPDLVNHVAGLLNEAIYRWPETLSRIEQGGGCEPAPDS